MKLTSILLWLVAVLAFVSFLVPSTPVFPAKGPSAATAASIPACVVAFGDSITRGYGLKVGEGWVELLGESLKKEGKNPIPVINAGVTGNTSGAALQRIEAQVLARMPGLVLVEFGGNDAIIHHDTPDDFEKNMLKIHELIVGKGGEVIFVTFPPVINDWFQQNKNPFFSKYGGADQYIEVYRQRTRDIAGKLKCPLFDLDKQLRELIKKDKPETYIQKDGIHLTSEANIWMAKAVLEFLRDNGKLPAKTR
ncbi:MAG: hypothetical protein HZA50_12515 [Planctomycetes bacterium]|nr:hypothetical protein [Planctomycetota bacterium]